MDIKITPNKLKGTVNIPSSKSVTHRMLICAALSDGNSVLSGITMSKDIEATINALTQIGAEITVKDDVITVKGTNFTSKNAVLNCNESGSTLRFMIPVVCALGISSVFKGKGKLPERPITPYLREFTSKGIAFDYENTMPFTVSGKLIGGKYTLEGDISSQFITGLLFALPLCSEDSEIILSSPLQSKPYVDITIDCLKKFGIEINETGNGYFVKGHQKYLPFSENIEGDYSQAAFYFVANALGSDIKIENVNDKSVQGDKKILEILSEIGYNENVSGLKCFCVGVGDIPDLVPILTVLGCFCNGVSKITNAGRLRIKESDRLEAIACVLNKLGGKVTVLNDELIIEPINHFVGGTIDSFNDHRIVMATAIASTKCDGEIIIENANTVEKSYPEFFRDFNNLGGKSYVICLE